MNKHLCLKISSKRDLLKIHLPGSPAVRLAAWLALTHSPAGLARQPLPRAIGFPVWSLNGKVGENSVPAELGERSLL